MKQIQAQTLLQTCAQTHPKSNGFHDTPFFNYFNFYTLAHINFIIINVNNYGLT